MGLPSVAFLTAVIVAEKSGHLWGRAHLVRVLTNQHHMNNKPT
jgi:hypothetical protein